MKRVFAALLVICLALGLLCGCGAPKNKTTKYMVLVMDQENAPVRGVMVQFCDDQLCTAVTTDEKGIAELEKEPGKYSVHILKVPEGFAPYDLELSIGPEADMLTVNLSPAA